MEIWASGVPAPRGIVHVARETEENGWDGLNVVDSQNLAADPFVALAMAATATTTLKLGTGGLTTCPQCSDMYLTYGVCVTSVPACIHVIHFLLLVLLLLLCFMHTLSLSLSCYCYLLS